LDRPATVRIKDAEERSYPYLKLEKKWRKKENGERRAERRMENGGGERRADSGDPFFALHSAFSALHPPFSARSSATHFFILPYLLVSPQNKATMKNRTKGEERRAKNEE
jgi:hypothetical protein